MEGIESAHNLIFEILDRNGFYDLAAYYTAWMKTGITPSILLCACVRACVCVGECVDTTLNILINYAGRNLLFPQKSALLYSSYIHPSGGVCTTISTVSQQPNNQPTNYNQPNNYNQLTTTN